MWLKHGSWKGLIIHPENKTEQCQWHNGVEEMGQWNYTLLFSEIKSIGAQTGTVGEHWAHLLHLIDLKHFQLTNASEKNKKYRSSLSRSTLLGQLEEQTTQGVKCASYESHWKNTRGLTNTSKSSLGMHGAIGQLACIRHGLMEQCNVAHTPACKHNANIYLSTSVEQDEPNMHLIYITIVGVQERKHLGRDTS